MNAPTVGFAWPIIQCAALGAYALKRRTVMSAFVAMVKLSFIVGGAFDDSLLTWKLSISTQIHW